MIGFCDRCDVLEENVVLKKVEEKVDKPMGVSLLLLCDKCRD